VADKAINHHFYFLQQINNTPFNPDRQPLIGPNARQTLHIDSKSPFPRKKLSPPPDKKTPKNTLQINNLHNKAQPLLHPWHGTTQRGMSIRHYGIFCLTLPF
jgi:hypothetical protein